MTRKEKWRVCRLFSFGTCYVLWHKFLFCLLTWTSLVINKASLHSLVIQLSNENWFSFRHMCSSFLRKLSKYRLESFPKPLSHILYLWNVLSLFPISTSTLKAQKKVRLKKKSIWSLPGKLPYFSTIPANCHISSCFFPSKTEKKKNGRCFWSSSF